MSIGTENQPQIRTKTTKKASPPGPAIKVVAFVALMKKLEAHKEHLTNEEVRFVQNAIQRFEHEPLGMVKTKHVLPKPKKIKRSGMQPTGFEPHPPSQATKGFIERLVRLANEDEALTQIHHLTDSDAERLAREQGLRANSPDIARQKLAETIVTLREIERIAGAGKPQP